MNQRTVFTMILIALGLMGLLLLLNVGSTYQNTGIVRFLAPNNVSSMAVEHNNILYPLNFNQQHQLISAINRSVKVVMPPKESFQSFDFPYSKVIVYLFQGDDIIIKPVGLINNQLVYTSPIWNPDGNEVLQETGAGEINSVLLNSFDKK